MKKGDVVYNSIFGSGKIISITPEYACIKFDSLKTTRNIKIGYFKKVV